MAIKKPWFEIYRPLSLDDVVFASERIEQTFANIRASGELPNLLIHGPSGTGKSSLSGALLRDLDIDTMDRLRINCSDEKIDAMREKVRGFAMTMPIGRSFEADVKGDTRPEFKVVQLEEMDYLSLDAQALLRSLIEDTSGSCRFIATCNYINKIIPALQSRFQVYEFRAPDRDKVLLRMADILEKQNVDFEVDDLDRIVQAGYPDMRKIVTLLEQNSSGGELIISEAASASDWKLGLLPILEAGDVKGARKLVCDSATREELIDVFKFLYENVERINTAGVLRKSMHAKNTIDGKYDEAIILIAQYQYQHAFAADGEINIAALFIELSKLFQGTNR